MPFRLSALAVLLVLLPAVVAAQLPSNTAYLSLHGYAFQPVYGVLGIDLGGAPTGFLPVPNRSGNYGGMVTNATNDGLLVVEDNGFHHLDLGTGTSTFTSLNGQVMGLTLDEDAGLVWDQNWTLYRSQTLAGTNPVRLTTVHAISPARGSAGPCWNGTTGGYVTCSPGAAGVMGVLEFFDRAGNCTKSIGGMGYIMAIAWSPWTGDLVLSDRIAGTLLRVAQHGVITTIGSLPAQPYLAGVFHQNATRTEQFLVVRHASPQFDILVVTGTGAVRTLITGVLLVHDADVLGSRPLWSTGPWSVGHVGRLSLNPGPTYAHQTYRLALSFSHQPGLNLGRAQLHLTPDALFHLTGQGDVPGLTRGFSGVLDAQGRAVVAPEITIPNVPALRGLRVFGGGLFFQGGGITGATNCWGITIQ